MGVSELTTASMAGVSCHFKQGVQPYALRMDQHAPVALSDAPFAEYHKLCDNTRCHTIRCLHVLQQLHCGSRHVLVNVIANYSSGLVSILLQLLRGA